MTFNKDKLKEQLKDWYQINKYKFYIDEPGSWLHFIAPIIHFVNRYKRILPSLKTYARKNTVLSSADRQKITKKLSLYKQKQREKHQDEFGFIDTKHCDATLFSGLQSAAGVKVDLIQARSDDGAWHRRPKKYEACYPGHSRSSLSRDMCLGMFWSWYSTKDLKSAEEFYEYCKKNNYIIGKGDPSTLMLGTAMETLLCELIYSLGGKDHPARKYRRSWSKNLDGFLVHLVFLHIALSGEINGYIDEKMMDVVEYYAFKYPYNPFYETVYFRYTTKSNDFSSPLAQLLNSNLWPLRRLPTRKDRKSSWITQRDEGKDWEPSTTRPTEEHHGGDFIFAAWYLLK